MLARILQTVTLVLVSFVSWWLWASWEQSPGLAISGLAIGILAYASTLATQFALLPWANRNDPLPKASWQQLAIAWWGEMCALPVVFCWRQPFRSRLLADSVNGEVGGRRGVVFVHGFMCNRGLWNPWLSRLKARGHPFIAVNLEPVFGSIEDYVPIVDRAVSAMARATGVPPLLVCHSMGGLAARAWVRAMGAGERVHRVVTIGSPHRGTLFGNMSNGIEGLRNARQMVYGSKWLLQLEGDEPPEVRAQLICFHSNCDNMVMPSATATLVGADNRLVPGVAHVALAYDETVLRDTLALL